MTTITPEFLDELERGLEGVTPGPWKADQANSRKYLDVVEFSYLSGMKGSVSFVGPKHANVGASELDEQNANSAHIARCDPDTIRALIALARKGMRRVVSESTYDADDGQPDEAQEWRDYDPDC